MSSILQNYVPSGWISNLKYRWGKRQWRKGKSKMGDHVIKMEGRQIEPIKANYSQRLNGFVVTNEDGDAELYRTPKKYYSAGQTTGLFLEDIEDTVGPARIKAEEKIKRDEKLREKINDSEFEGIPVDKEKVYLDPEVVDDSTHTVDSDTARQLYTDAEEIVKNIEPDEDESLFERLEPLIYFFTGIISAVIVAMALGGSGGGGSGGGGIPTIGFLIPLIAGPHAERYKDKISQKVENIKVAYE